MHVTSFLNNIALKEVDEMTFSGDLEPPIFQRPWCNISHYVNAVYCMAAISQFSILVGQKMRLTG